MFLSDLVLRLVIYLVLITETSIPHTEVEPAMGSTSDTAVAVFIVRDVIIVFFGAGFA
jgi:hypothetical protein